MSCLSCSYYTSDYPFHCVQVLRMSQKALLIWLFCHSDLPLSHLCSPHGPPCFISNMSSVLLPYVLSKHYSICLIALCPHSDTAHSPTFSRPPLMLCSSEMPSVTTICNMAFSTLTFYFALSRFIFL